MTDLEILKQIKASVQNAMKNDVAENYKYLIVEGELIRIYFLVEKLLKERNGEE